MQQVQGMDDTEAFRCLYDRHAVSAYRVAYSVCGDRQRSEDAVQEGFLSVWRGRNTFHPAAGSFQAWAMAIVRGAAINSVRRDKAAKRPPVAGWAAEIVDRGTRSAEDEAIARSQAHGLRAALGRLPRAQAEVIALAFFGELSHAEIATRLAIPPGTVKGRMRLGLRKLRARGTTRTGELAR